MEKEKLHRPYHHLSLCTKDVRGSTALTGLVSTDYYRHLREMRGVDDDLKSRTLHLRTWSKLRSDVAEYSAARRNSIARSILSLSSLISRTRKERRAEAVDYNSETARFGCLPAGMFSQVFSADNESYSY